MSARRRLLLALAAAAPLPASAYVRTTASCSGGAVSLSWQALPVHYVVDSAGTPDVPGTSALDAVDASFATWQAPACTSLRFQADGRVANPPVGFDPSGPNTNVVKWIESGWTLSSAAIAVTTTTFSCATGEIRDADITLNGQNFTFTTEPSTTAADVQNTVTHEVGHLVGFDHSPDPASTMYAFAAPGETKKRDLTADDVQGVCDVYPTAAPPPPSPPPAPPARASTHHGGCSSGEAAGPAAALLAALGALRPRRRGAPLQRPPR